MTNCPHCNTKLPIETLASAGEPVCPSCGQPIDLSEEDGNLSSLAGGSPADATIQLGSDSDSSSTDLSLDESAAFSGEASPADSSLDMTIDSGDLSAINRDANEGADDDTDFDATLVYGDRPDHDDDDFESDDLEQGFLLEDDPEGPSESLDATIDFGHLEARAKAGREDDATVGPEGLAGLGAAGDLTRMLDDSVPANQASNAGELTTDSAQLPNEGGGLPAADSEALGSQEPTPTGDETERGGSSAFSDSSLERTDPPSDSADDATLQFDSDIRSANVNTPQALDITGLGSEDTLPRGPLGQGRASASLRPGESMIVGDESVRLRAFELSEADPTGAREIDYKIEGEAGKGGMGVVYKARQQSLDRLVAIKQIKSEMGASESDRNKFVSEAVITGQLEHPNIAPVHDLGLAADGLPFYAMKFVDGDDWEDTIKELSEEENLAILIQVAQAIAFAHSRNILHRDLKPGNVRLGSFGEVLVMDWGLAARLDDGSEIQPAGTPIYMPPETALEYLDYAKGKVVGGNRIGSSRRRVPAGTYCDIYLLGALLFKIVTGRAPHRGKTTFECLRAAAKNDIVKVRRSSELLDIAYRAMATEPEDRYTSALDFIEAIRAYQSHAQSILIAKRASTDLRQAGRLVDSENPDATQLYALFSSAQNGYQNALDLWEGNRKAARRLKKSQRMFAEAAYANGDYDLALSLLDDPNEEDASLRRSIVGSQKSRNARLTWFKTLQYATAASLVLALSFIAYSVVAKLDAISARAEAIAEADKATTAKAEAERAKTEAIRSEQLAADAAAKAAEETGRAAAAQAEALVASREAAESKEDAAQAIAAAEEAEALLTVAERNARQAAEQAKQQSYLAAFGQIRATLSDSGSYAAWKVMQKVDPAVAAIGSDRPEWQFLMKAIDWRDEATELVGEDPAQLSRPTLIATSSNAEWLVTATKAGNAIVCSVYRGGDRVSVQKFDVPGVLYQVTIDSSGRYIAFAGSELRVFDRSNGAVLPAQTLPKAVTCLAFHPTQSELLVGTRSTAVERWTIEAGRLARLESDAQWHRTGVTAVGYSADGTQRVSADDSGRLVVWRLRDGKWSERKTIAHSGAGSPRITAAVLADSPSGRLAYGCDDGAVYEGFGWWENDRPSSNPDGGLAEAAFERLNTYHPSAVTSIGYAIGGSTILSSGGDTLLVRRSPTLTSAIAAGLKTLETERRYHDAKVLACGAGRDGFAYSSDERGRVLRWQIEASPSETTLQPAEGNSGVAAVQLSPAGNQLAVADEAGFVRTWSDLSKAQASSTAYVGHADHRDLTAWHLKGSPDRLVTIAADNRACVWRAEDGLLERTIDLGGRTVVAVDPTRRMLYAVSDGRLVDGSSAVAWPIDGGVRRELWDSNARVAAIHPLGSDKQSLAVGLRDGQVALWQSDLGRIELVRSSGRPHWRPISAFAYDPASGRLYSGDTGGLVAAWDLADGAEPIERLLSNDVQTGPAAIARIELASGKRLLVVQRSDQAVIPSLLRTDLSSVADSSLATPTLLDAAFDPASDSVVGIRRSGNQREFVAWEPDRGWRPIGQPIKDPVAKLRTTSNGWLAWGGNRVQWNSRRGEMLPLSITSRPRTEAFVASASETVQAITASGSVTEWDAAEHLLRQRAIPYAGELLASCEGALADQVVLAIAQAGEGCRIELWSTATNKRLAVLAELPEPAKKLVRSGDRVIAVAHDQITSLSLDGEAPESIKLPTGVGRAVSVAWDPNSQRLAIATAPGRAFLAERLGGRRWHLMPIDREDISSIAFTPDGDRLLVGVESGRVLMLSLETVSEGVQATRSVLSLPGHGNRVTLIEVAQTAEGAQIVSGDASGRVVVRSL